MTYIFYLFIELVALCAFYMGINKKNKYGDVKSRILICFAFIILLSVIIFRDLSVGTDYIRYYNAINRVQYNRMYSYDESWLSVGLIGMVRLAVIIGIPSKILPFVIIGIMAFITLYFFFKAFIEISSRPTLSLYIFLCFCLYFQIMNQFKQMLAISIVLLAYKYIDKSFLKYMVMILFACMFHPSAAIMLPMYFVVKIKISKKILVLYLAIGLLGVFSYSRIISLFQFTKYYNYFGREGLDVAFKASVLLNLAVRVALLFCCLLVRKRLIAKKPKSEILYHMIIVCTILQLFTVLSYLFGRITTYFYVYYILLLPDVFTELRFYISKESRHIFDKLIYLALFLYQCIYYFGQSVGSGYDSYSFIFGK